jgi:hypothetical protein
MNAHVVAWCLWKYAWMTAHGTAQFLEHGTTWGLNHSEGWANRAAREATK